MDQRTMPSPRIKPLPADHSPELKEQFEAMRKNLGFIPNSILIMQRKPKLAKALAQMTAAVWDPEGEVDRGFKRIIAHVASRAAGCRYCMAHTAGGALHFGVDDKKLAAVWEYQTSPLYSAAERATLDFAIAAASVPNEVTDDMFAELRKHWSEEQIVEIVGVIALFGFLNRWNDTMATPLEERTDRRGRTLPQARRLDRRQASRLTGLPHPTQSWPGSSRPSTSLPHQEEPRRGCPAQGRA
jgi:uncharacterized peroxidase-related enzyme